MECDAHKSDAKRPLLGKALSPQEVNIYLGKHLDEICPAVEWAYENRRFFKPPSIFAALYVMIVRARKTGSRQFFNKLASGEDLHRGDPILTVRNKLTNMYSDRSLGRPDPLIIAGLVIQAWNAHVQERAMDKVGGVRRNPDGSIKFPLIRSSKYGYTPEDDGE